ncbi:MAG: hypothetical protein R3C53_02455 [Pirellulaceae bacterium]
MSGTRRQRDNLAPSLFPFLAVLLCTMGALVLILMLLVAGAQTTAQVAAAETQQQADDAEALLEHARRAYEKQLDEGRVALEKKRLVLQHLEEHIQELLAELEDLERTAGLVEKQQEQDEAADEERRTAISELEKQLAEATAELQTKIDKPDGDKPIFAIIPYQGTNGTHRRPIYLECTAQGVFIQPEGVRITPGDLRPPYGPGNPLDAALRTVRAEFPPGNGAVTSTAYPLLVVRPSGIAAYTMARAAMSGWDDQFGYELVSEDLELAFPESAPGLKDKLVKAIDLARDRQAALVMAMPNQYHGGRGAFDDEQFGTTNREAGTGATGSGSFAEGSFAGGSSNQSRIGSGDANGPGGFAEFGDASSSESGSMTGNGFGMPGDESLAASGQTLSGDPPSLFGPARGELQNNALASSEPYSGLRPSGLYAGNDPTLLANNSNEFGTADGSGAAGAASTSNNRSFAGAEGIAGQMPSASGQQFQLPFSTGPAQVPASGSSASGSPNNSSASGPTGSSSQASNNASSSNSAAASEQAGMSPQLSLNKDFSKQNESAQPVASSRGRNWAWSQGPPTETPVVRSIRIQCLEDRWLVLPDRGSSARPTVITFDESPRQRAERLAKTVIERVDSWGLALTGGYWKPVLTVEVAPNAAWRYEQLARLLEGSGLEVTPAQAR